MIPRLVREIEGGTLSVTEKGEDWSWGILEVGYNELQCIAIQCCEIQCNTKCCNEMSCNVVDCIEM